MLITANLRRGIAVDGSKPMEGDLSLGDHQIRQVAPATEPNDAVNLGQVQSLVGGLNFSSRWLDPIDSVGLSPNSFASEGYRQLIAASYDTSTGQVLIVPATSIFAGFEGKIAVKKQIGWGFVNPEPSSFLALYGESKGVFLFSTKWSFQIFESTLASDGLIKEGNTIKLDPNIAGTGLKLIDNKLIIDNPIISTIEIVENFESNQYTLEYVPINNSLYVVANGLILAPIIDYTISDNIVIFTTVFKIETLHFRYQYANSNS